MHEPDALFLDEPTSGVDPITRREFWTHINGLVGKGVAILVTTHFMDEAEYCDRIALIYRGETIALGSPDDLKAKAGRQDMPTRRWRTPSFSSSRLEATRKGGGMSETAAVRDARPAPSRRCWQRNRSRSCAIPPAS